MPTFEVKVPVGVSQIGMRGQIRDAIAEATSEASFDPISGLAHRRQLRRQPRPGTPIIHFEQWETRRDRSEAHPEGRRLRKHERAVRAPRPSCQVSVAQTGPSKVCASASSTPCGMRKARVCTGSDWRRHWWRSHVGLRAAKEQLFRTLDDVNPDPRLAELEASIMGEVNSSDWCDGVRWPRADDRVQGRRAQSAACELLRLCGIRLLGLPSASLYLDSKTGEIKRWLYRDRVEPRRSWRIRRVPENGTRSRARTPITEEQVRALKVGDVVLLSGRVTRVVMRFIITSCRTTRRWTCAAA